MAYRETKTRNGRSYYYRVISLRKGSKVMKKRIYLGVNLPQDTLRERERAADNELTSKKVNVRVRPLIKKIVEVLKKYKIKKAGIFGSYALGKQRKKSDIDILIEPPKGMGLRFVSLALELEDKLGRKVDLVSYNGISPYLRKSILEHEQRIV